MNQTESHQQDEKLKEQIFVLVLAKLLEKVSSEMLKDGLMSYSSLSLPISRLAQSITIELLNHLDRIEYESNPDWDCWLDKSYQYMEGVDDEIPFT